MQTIFNYPRLNWNLLFLL